MRQRMQNSSSRRVLKFPGVIHVHPTSHVNNWKERDTVSQLKKKLCPRNCNERFPKFPSLQSIISWTIRECEFSVNCARIYLISERPMIILPFHLERVWIYTFISAFSLPAVNLIEKRVKRFERQKVSSIVSTNITK